MISASDLGDHTAIIIDVFRASTTILEILENGAEAVVPCKNPQLALDIHEKQRGYLLGGEKGGVKIPGFDAGNSPGEYTSEIVSRQTIILSTSHGTVAIEHARQAASILIGCFRNLSAVVSHAVALDKPIVIICSGTDQETSIEDTLCGGEMLTALESKYGYEIVGDGAFIALAASKGSPHSDALVTSGRAYERLTNLGFSKDIELALRRDSSSLVPYYFADFRQIRLDQVRKSE